MFYHTFWDASKIHANRTISNDFNNLHGLAWSLHGMFSIANRVGSPYPPDTVLTQDIAVSMEYHAPTVTGTGYPSRKAAYAVVFSVMLWPEREKYHAE